MDIMIKNVGTEYLSENGRVELKSFNNNEKDKYFEVEETVDWNQEQQKREFLQQYVLLSLKSGTGIKKIFEESIRAWKEIEKEVKKIEEVIKGSV